MQHSYLLAGISSGKLIRLLSRNGFSLYPKYILRLLFLLQGSLFASVFNRMQKAKMGTKLKNYKMPTDPIFIIGHWRTGSTLLHQLMSLDSNLVTPNVLQVSTPASFLVSEKFYKPVMSKAMKPTRPMDNVKLDVLQPQEDEYALIKLTADSPLEKLLFPKTERYFLMDYDNFRPVYLKNWKKSLVDFCLQLSYTNRKQVLLKNPFHSMRIQLLREVSPNAKFIHIHRNPYEVVPSTIHMWKVVGEENKLKRKNQNFTVEDVAIVNDRMIKKIWEDLKSVPENAKVEVGFKALEEDPITTLKEIYAKLDLNYSVDFEAKVTEWLSGVKSYKKNKYSLSVSEKETIRKILGEQFIYYNYKQ